MGKNYPYYRKSMIPSFPDFLHTTGFVAFSRTMASWWENPCISHIMRFVNFFLWYVQQHSNDLNVFDNFNKVKIFRNGELLSNNLFEGKNHRVWRTLSMVLQKNYHLVLLESVFAVGLFRKKFKQEGFRIYIYEKHWNFQICHLTLRNSGVNKLLPLEILKELCDTPWKLWGQKPRPMEIPHEFFLNTLENSTSFSLTPGFSRCSLLYHPWKFRVLNRPVCFFSGIAHFYSASKDELKEHPNIKDWLL